jgi:hypothetical protein
MNVTEVQPQTANSKGIFANAFNLGSASSGTFQLQGGYYCLAASATWGGGSATLEMLGPDGVTFIATALLLSANGLILGYLPAGQYKIVVATATAVYASVQSVPI